MTNASIKQLRYFQALAQHHHFGRAAQACAVSQPALSMQIRELERELGKPLFERGGRSVTLTPVGEAIAARITGIVRAVDDLADSVRATEKAPSGRLRMGIIPTIAPYLLPRIVPALKQQFPAVDLTMRESQTARLVEELADGRLDTAIVALPVSEPDFTETPLFDEPFMLARPRAEANLPVPDREMLSEMRLLLLEEGHCFRDQALSYCNPGPVSARTVMDGSSLTTLVQMVSAGLGVTLIPKMAVDVEQRSADICLQELPDPQPQRTIGMIWRRTTPLSHHLGAIAQALRQLA